MGPDELALAAEVFLTGTSAGVWPVESIDGRPVGHRVPGPLSARLRERFLEVGGGRDPAFHHWLAFVEPSRPAGG